MCLQRFEERSATVACQPDSISYIFLQILHAASSMAAHTQGPALAIVIGQLRLTDPHYAYGINNFISNNCLTNLFLGTDWAYYNKFGIKPRVATLDRDLVISKAVVY
jgi:hypothetical protein